MIYATRIACGLRCATQVEARLRLEAPLTLEATTRKGSVGLFNFPFFASSLSETRLNEVRLIPRSAAERLKPNADNSDQ